MKRKNTILVLSFMLLFGLGLTGFEIMKPDGAPAGQTGSPGDGSTCASCHGGNVQNVSGWITTDIPAEGYTPGQTYQITCTNTLSGSGKYGFECSPQNIAGALQGTLTAGTNNKLVGTGKYVTHTLANTTTNSWTFSWTAPAATIGSVTFYGAFARGSSGNVAKTSLTVTKASGVGISGISPQEKLTIFPNPSIGRFKLGNLPAHPEQLSITNLSGKLVRFNATMNEQSNTMEVDLGNPPAGVYFLNFNIEGQAYTEKAVVR